jgi:hypothetical protein
VYNILFIDETQDDINHFLDYIDSKNVNDQVSVDVLLPQPDVESLLRAVLEKGADAVIVDFQLNDYKELVDYNVPYNGVDFAEELNCRKEGFPCFVITSFEDDAIRVSDDVNVVYQKDILHKKETAHNASFIDRVMQQIEHYRARIADAEKEFNTLLIQRRTEQLDASSESRLKELDCFLERASHQHSALPAELKDKTLKADLHKLIANTDALLKTLDSEND